MLLFDSDQNWSHSIYGYLFLKKMSPLGEFAHPILYHHLPYGKYTQVKPPLTERDFSGLILLADRIDIAVSQKGAQFCRDWIMQQKGTRLSPYWVNLFIAAEKNSSILDILESGDYQKQMDDLEHHIDISGEDLGRYLSIIAYAIDFRSEFMVLHTVNTVSISHVIGKHIGLSSDELEALHYGALLHDIGKISCPVSILEKPGRLTPEEMEIMRRHVEITREILNGLMDPVIVEIACRHHERIDGSGYPQGLPYENLDTPQRILAVADVVSALIRQRSYKTAYDKEKTLTILSDLKKENRFCCNSIDSVLDHFDEVIKVSEEHGAAVTNAYQSIHHEYEELMSRPLFS